MLPRKASLDIANYRPVILDGMSKLHAQIGPSILNADLSDLKTECQSLVELGADYLHLDVMDGQFVPEITFGTVLDCDLSNLKDQSKTLFKAGADFFHFDIMDGMFVPELTFGPGLVKCLRKNLTEPFFDMHMMVADPDKWIRPMWDAMATQYTFHLEASPDPHATIRKVREVGFKNVGLAIKPNTPVEEILQYLDKVDMALIMTVEPGKGGQTFMEDQLDKVRAIRQAKPLLNIEVDGGVGPANVQLCAEAGANMIVSGTAVVSSTDPKMVMDTMREKVVRALDARRVHY